jgi:dATP pyrophosphohydrolase
VHKLPVSVLVVIHTPEMQVLLLERAGHPGFWQSVTGSLHEGETPEQTARREVGEETGIDAARYPLRDLQQLSVFEIYSRWRHRYAPGVLHNTEHAYAMEVPEALPVTVAPDEHTAWKWVSLDEAARRVFSWSNAAALRRLAATRAP